MESSDEMNPIHRRRFLQVGTIGLIGLAPNRLSADEPKKIDLLAVPVDKSKPTRFQIACMTLPYSQFPLNRALEGIQKAGYKFVAWGTAHQEADGKRTPVLAADATPKQAKELATRCRDLGLEPVMLFGGAAPDNGNGVAILKQRIQQASAAGVGQILTMGNTKGNDRKTWVMHLKELGPIARDQGVLIVIKQHGGNTGTGAACAEITREVADGGIKVSFDAGNVMDYHKIDPLPDIRKCADEVHSYCIKDHRFFPKDEDCGPGWGEIDHYRLLQPVAFTGHTVPLCCENIFVPVIPRPATPEGIDALARRAREFLEVVVQGLQT